MNENSNSFTLFSIIFCFALFAPFSVLNAQSSVQFLPNSDAIQVLESAQVQAQTQLSSLSINDADYQQASTELEFEIGVSSKMINAINASNTNPEAVKAALVHLLSELENVTIDPDTYAYRNQALGSSAQEVNVYVLDLLAN